MTYSMTAFARAQKEFETGSFCWEIRSVNHRYLDLFFRLPEPLRFLENDLRAMMRGQVSRGKVECQLTLKMRKKDSQALFVNESLVNGLLETANQLASTTQLKNDLSLTTILAWPGVIEEKESDVEILANEAKQLFDEAIKSLLMARKTEGQSLREHIETRLFKMADEVENAKRCVASNTKQMKEKLMTRLQALAVEVDNARFEQEIAFMLTRLDVTEELDRLQTHLTEVSKTLKSAEAAGRRLDFLMQELNREANTLSSKSDSIALTQSAVAMKVLIEQMREQIQNIE
jgi:uncharacterized protein (TIGR00255 family)